MTLLRELKPLTISRTKKGTGESYISLAHDNSSYTFFTTEITLEHPNGFVMVAVTKDILVDILFEPNGNPETLLNCSYPLEFEDLKQKALDWLFTTAEKQGRNTKKQILNIIKQLIIAKNKGSIINLTEPKKLQEELIQQNNFAKNESSNEELTVDEKEQEQIINEFESQDILKQEIITDLKNLNPTDPEIIIINSKSYKRDNRTIAQIKILRDFKCQICSTTIKKKDGTLYIEAAHIEPKHRKGYETPDNILILCPNHHKEFDFGDRIILQQDKDNINFTLNGQEYKISLKIE